LSQVSGFVCARPWKVPTHRNPMQGRRRCSYL
jgi:hypothetical protein